MKISDDERREIAATLRGLDERIATMMADIVSRAKALAEREKNAE